MKKSLLEMSDTEIRQYLSENRHNEEAFSQALEVLMNRKRDNFKYPPPSEMDAAEIEAIFKAKLDRN